MISIKNEHELEAMREACKITAAARALAGKMVRPGVSTKAIDQAVHDYIVSQGAKPSFLNYSGYPASACISVNSTVIHGIPGHYILRDGDIVSVDVGAYYKGFHGDCAATYACGSISTEAQKLIDVTRQSFFEGIKKAVAGNHLFDISNAIADYVEPFGYGIVEELVGHGIGHALHEDPQIPNFRQKRKGIRLMPGMTLAIEPMINLGTYKTRQMPDGWLVCTRDGLPSAHFEKTVAITEDGPVVLTCEEGHRRPV